eukprot:353077-Chlamydomonas_euryale.AAC.6
MHTHHVEDLFEKEADIGVLRAFGGARARRPGRVEVPSMEVRGCYLYFSIDALASTQVAQNISVSTCSSVSPR